MAEGVTDEGIVKRVKGQAMEILGEYTNMEHAARVVILDHVSRLNCVFEELGVKYAESRFLTRFGPEDWGCEGWFRCVKGWYGEG